MTIPTDLYNEICTLGYFAVPATQDQSDARQHLSDTLDGGSLPHLSEALHQVAHSYSFNRHGKRIPARVNWVTKTARKLGEQVSLLGRAAA